MVPAVRPWHWREAGAAVLMHGSNEHSAGISVEAGLQTLGLQSAVGRDDAGRRLRRERFAYLPLAAVVTRDG